MTDTPKTVEVDVKITVEGGDPANTDPTFSATAFCPVCCSTVDVIGTGLQCLDCAHCHQVVWLVIDAERFARHSAV